MAGPEVETEVSATLNWREGLPLLVSPRVVLRELRRADATPLWHIARSPAIARYSWPAPASIDAFESFVTTAWRERALGKYACFAIVPRGQAEPAGVFELRSLQPGFFRAELGLMIEPALFDNGVFNEGMRLVCDFAVRTVGVHRIEIRSAIDDAACCAALDKLGVKKEAVLRSAFVHCGRFEDQCLWSVVKGLDPLAPPR
jgi:ribosomal-protein-alanine N-acetyltransferase